jgi:hypothetical protein
MTRDSSGIWGEATIQLIGPDGDLKSTETFRNKITDKGDEYYAKKATANIPPVNTTEPADVLAMKLGTGATAAAKTDGVQTYISGSNVAFDATYPQTEDLGTTLGWNGVYVTTWVPGVATNAAITEACIVKTNADSTSNAADTISRVVFTAINKGAGDTLVITWKHKFLGA